MADQPRAYSEQRRRARKPHKCHECGTVIHPKDEYQYISGIWDKPESFRECLECAAAKTVIDAIFAPYRKKLYFDDEDFCFPLGAYFVEARDVAWEFRHDLQPGQYFRILRECVKRRRRRIAAKAAASKG